MASSGITRSTAPAFMASAGIPNTTQLASSCAMLNAPACFISSIPFGAVVAHAGHDHADHVPAAITRGRTEQHVHRGPVTADQGPVPDFHVIARAAALEQKMPVPGRDQSLAANHRIVVPGFLHGDPAGAVQPFGKARRELLRHMLHDDDPRRIQRHSLQEFAQRFGSPGGCSHRDYGFRGLDQRRRRGLGKHGIGGEFGRHHQFGRPGLGEPGPRRRLDRIANADTRLLEKFPGPQLRLGDDLDSSLGQRRESRIRTGSGQRRTDHHRNRVLAHNLIQKRQAVHARHLDIQRDDVRCYFLDARYRGIRVRSDAHHVDLRIRLQDFLQCLADRGRIVHDQYFHFARCHKLRA